MLIKIARFLVVLLTVAVAMAVAIQKPLEGQWFNGQGTSILVLVIFGAGGVAYWLLGRSRQTVHH